MTRKVVDCSLMKSESGCTLRITGREDEVLRMAVLHAVDVHGHRDTPELRAQIRALMEDEAPGST